MTYGKPPKVSPEILKQLDRYMLGQITKEQFIKQEDVTLYQFYALLSHQGIPTKIKCKCCGKLKQLSSFTRDKNRKFYRSTQCRECRNIKQKLQRGKHTPDVDPTTKTCAGCKETFPKTDEYFYPRKGTGYYNARCRTCQKEYATENSKRNKARHQKSVIKYMKKCQDTLSDLYVCTLLRVRKDSKYTMYKNEREDNRDLIEKARHKIKLEREIKTMILK